MLIEQTIVLCVLNFRLWASIPTPDNFNQDPAILLGIILFASMLVFTHYLATYLMFTYCNANDSVVKVLSVALIIEYLLLGLLLVLLLITGDFSKDDPDIKEFKKQGLVFLFMVCLIMLLQYPRALYISFVIFEKTQISSNNINDEHEIIQLIKIDFASVLEILKDEQVAVLQDKECPICLSPFLQKNEYPEAEAAAKVRSCGHYFHETCIKGWLEYRDVCPLDRKRVV